MTNRPASAAAPPTETFAEAIARINALSPGSLLTSYQKDAASPVGWVQVEITRTSAFRDFMIPRGLMKASLYTTFAAHAKAVVPSDDARMYSDNVSYLMFADVIIACQFYDTCIDAWFVKMFEPADIDATFADLRNAEEPDDPYISPEELKGVDLELAGDFTKDDVAAVVRDIIATSPDAAQYTKANSLKITAADSDSDAYISLIVGCTSTDIGIENPRDAALLQCVLDRFQPFGYTYEYNDGVGDRLSGYDKNAEQIIVDLDAPPPSATLRAADRVLRARDIAAARKRLLDWLAANGFGADMAALVNAGAHGSST